MRGRILVPVFILVACGPAVELPGTGSASSDTSTGSPSQPSSSSGGDADGPGSFSTGVASADGTAGEAPAGPTYCDGDPYAVNPLRQTPYYECMRGLADFSAPFAGSDDSFSAYAQFYDVREYVPADHAEEVLDPWEGPPDCTLVRYGNSASGGVEDVLWEDAGDVTFTLGRDIIEAEEYGDPVSVIGYLVGGGRASARYGQPHGFVATGDTTAPFEHPTAVVLPPTFGVVTPPFGGTPTLSPEQATVSWEPATQAEFMVTVSVVTNVPGDWDFALSCMGPDDGVEVLPAELLSQFPRPIEARLRLSREHKRLMPTEDGRFILVTARTGMETPVNLE